MTGVSPQSRLDAELAHTRQRIAGLETELAQMISASADSNADDEHDPEGATIAFERQQLQAVLDHARATGAQLEAASARAAEGQYGICARCGRPIAPERLAARPMATLCITCA